MNTLPKLFKMIMGSLSLSLFIVFNKLNKTSLFVTMAGVIFGMATLISMATAYLFFSTI